MNAFYNEFDPYAAQWTENLSNAGHIARGVVDRRSIVDLRPEDLAGFTQAHFFAGLGGWSYALRLAGWPDDVPVWTGSCPCQPYSVAGKGEGVEDERHLWPDWFRLIDQRRPAAIFGEQVASKPALAWLDTVRADLEGAGYAFGAADLASAGAGAPHIRQRLYFCAFRLADPDSVLGGQGSANLRGRTDRGVSESRTGSCGGGAGGLANNNNNNRRGVLGPPRIHGGGESGNDADGRSTPDGLGDTGSSRSRGDTGAFSGAESGAERSVRGFADQSLVAGPVGGLGDHHHHQGPQGHGGDGNGGGQPGRVYAQQAGSIGAAGATRGFWADADWLPCRDGKWRPVEPGTFPLAHGAPARVGRLRAYGNAINVHLAATFIKSAIESFDE